MRFIHLTSSEMGATVVRATLQVLGRDELVLHTVDGISVGPLRDIDGSRASRVAWWSRLEGRPLSARAARRLDDSTVWKQLRATDAPVVLWHGPFPTERLLAIRACWYLRDEPSRLYEVKLPRGRNPNLPAFYGALGIVGPKVAVEAWPTLRRVRDVERRAKRWVEIRSRRGDWIRHLAGDRVVELPLTAYDAALERACRAEWTSSRLALARVLATIPAGDLILRWRVRVLMDAGRIVGRGPRNDLGLPNEIHAPRR